VLGVGIGATIVVGALGAPASLAGASGLAGAPATAAAGMTTFASGCSGDAASALAMPALAGLGTGVVVLAALLCGAALNGPLNGPGLLQLVAAMASPSKAATLELHRTR
jgi:hypothetical protein